MNTSQIFILAAGRGERMRPLTDNIPKPLVEVAGVAMLDRIIQKVSLLSSITKIVVNAYYLSEQIVDHIKNLHNPKIIVSVENEKLETGGGLLNALPLFDQLQPILVINSDIVWLDENNSVLQKMLSSFDENNMDILLGLIPKNQFFGYEGRGDFNFNKVTGEIIKPASAEADYVYIGIQILHPKIFKSWINLNRCFSLNYFFQKARKEDGVLDRIKGVELDEKFFHVGTVEAVKKTSELI